MNLFKKDNLKFGLILGLLTPLLGVFVFYFWRYSAFSWSDYWYALTHNKPLVTALSSICLLCNIVIFTIYLNTKKDQTAKGIFAMTLLYGIGILLFKFLS